MSKMDKALALIAGVTAELEQGTLHYNKAGDLLTTPLEIIQCLMDEGEVSFVPDPQQIPVERGVG